MRSALLATSFLVMASGSAMAADAVVPTTVTESPVVAPERFGWTGAYVGAFGGLATGDFDYDAGMTGGGPPGSLDVSGSGFLGGVQAGYDWQSGNWVFGAVADIAATNHEASVSINFPGLATGEAKSELKYLGTVRARAGIANDRALIYAHGGFAYGKTEPSIELNGTTFQGDDPNRTGWTVGAGVEYAVTDQISFGTEYGYVDLGEEEIYNQGGIFINEDVSFHTIKAAINFRF